MYFDKDVWNGKVLQELFEKSNLSKSNISEALNMNISTLNSYMEEKQCPSLQVMLKLADFFAVPLDLFVGRLDEETSRNVVENYDKYFLKLRTHLYEEFISGRRDINSGYKADPPYPYNLLDSIVKYRDPNQWQDILTEDQEAALEYAISTLPERSKEMLLLYFQDNFTLEEIGKMYNLNKERIRQIVAKSVRMLRHPHLFNPVIYGKEGYKKFTELRRRKAELAEEELRLDKLEEELVNRRSMIEDGLMVEHNSKPAVTQFEYTPILEMALSVRSLNCLSRKGCKTIQDVIDLTKSGKLTDTRNLGKRSADEILRKVFFLTGEDYRFLYSKILKEKI